MSRLVSTHSFDVELAELHGVDAALIIGHFQHFIEHHRANKTNFYEGHYWTYDSAASLAEKFPYWSKNKIQKLLVKLEDKNLIASGDFSEDRFKRPKFYRVIADTLKPNGLLPTSQMADCTESQMADSSLSDQSTNQSSDHSLKSTKKNGLDFSPLGLGDEQIIEWKDLRKKAKAPITQRVINTIAKEFNKSRQAGFTNDQILDLLSVKGWKDYKHEWMLNSNRNVGAQAHGTHQPTKEHNGIGYGENADQSVFPEHLQIAHNDTPPVKRTKTAMQLTRIRNRSRNVLDENDGDIRGFVENQTG